MGITIYDLRTSHNRHPEFGDFVMCQHCGRYMLVNFGEDDCPICGEHTLQWADYGHRQVNLEYFAQTERYRISTLNAEDAAHKVNVDREISDNSRKIIQY